MWVTEIEREGREEVESGQGKDAKQAATAALISRLNSHGSYFESHNQKGLYADQVRRPKIFCVKVFPQAEAIRWYGFNFGTGNIGLVHEPLEHQVPMFLHLQECQAGQSF